MLIRSSQIDAADGAGAAPEWITAFGPCLDREDHTDTTIRQTGIMTRRRAILNSPAAILRPGLAGFLLVVAFFTPAQAHAYLDPATGSIVLQMLMGGVAGAALLVKVGWRRFLGIFGRGQQSTSEDDRPAG